MVNKINIPFILFSNVYIFNFIEVYLIYNINVSTIWCFTILKGYTPFSYYKILALFRVLYNIFIFVAYFIHNSLYLLIPYPFIAPPPSLSPPVTTNLFPIAVSLFLFLLYSLVCCIF